MISRSHQMAHVNGVYNAIYVTGDAVGETMFFGEGAGAGPAASAVMGDVLDVARHITLGVPPIVGCTCTDELPIVPMDNLETCYYLRIVVPDRVGVLAAAATTLLVLKLIAKKKAAAIAPTELAFENDFDEEEIICE
jgi:homoserine dehydrogenase